jgi:hypothetical protein
VTGSRHVAISLQESLLAVEKLVVQTRQKRSDNEARDLFRRRLSFFSLHSTKYPRGAVCLGNRTQLWDSTRRHIPFIAL